MHQEPSEKRLAKKRISKKETPIRHSIDPDKFEWDHDHKKCMGQGYLGYNITTKQLIPCKCLRFKAQPKETTNDQPVQTNN